MSANLYKAVGNLQGRVHGIESNVRDMKESLASIDEKLDKVIVQIAVARVANEKKRKRHGRLTAAASAIGTAIIAALIKWKSGT